MPLFFSLVVLVFELVQGESGQASACQKCADTCKALVSQCQDGLIKACYEATACLCRCNLAAGGCGGDKEVLRKCVEENEKRAGRRR